MDYYFHFKFPYIVTAEDAEEAKKKFEDELQEFLDQDRGWEMGIPEDWDIEKVENSKDK